MDLDQYCFAGCELDCLALSRQRWIIIAAAAGTKIDRPWAAHHFSGGSRFNHLDDALLLHQNA